MPAMTASRLPVDSDAIRDLNSMLVILTSKPSCSPIALMTAISKPSGTPSSFMYSNGGNSALVPTVRTCFSPVSSVCSSSPSPMYSATSLSNVPLSRIFCRPSLILSSSSSSPLGTAIAYSSVEVVSANAVSVFGSCLTNCFAGLSSIMTASTAPFLSVMTASVPFL